MHSWLDTFSGKLMIKYIKEYEEPLMQEILNQFHTNKKRREDLNIKSQSLRTCYQTTTTPKGIVDITPNLPPSDAQLHNILTSWHQVQGRRNTFMGVPNLYLTIKIDTPPKNTSIETPFSKKRAKATKAQCGPHKNHSLLGTKDFTSSYY